MRENPGNRHPQRRAQLGFTMVEVMVAFMLTAIATTGLVALYSIQTHAGGFSRHAMEATELAQDQVERLRTQVAPTSTTTGTQASLDAKGKLVTGGMFTRSWTITPNSSNCDIVVTVAWNEDGVDRNVVMRGKRNL